MKQVQITIKPNGVRHGAITYTVPSLPERSQWHTDNIKNHTRHIRVGLLGRNIGGVR